MDGLIVSLGEADILSILGAVKRGDVRVESSSLSYGEIARWWATALWRSAFPLRPAPVPDYAR